MDVSRYGKVPQKICREIEEHRVLANWLHIFPLIEQLRSKESKLHVLADFYHNEAKFEQLLTSLYHGDRRPGDDILSLAPESLHALERVMEMFRKTHHECGRSSNEAWCDDVKFLSRLLLCKARFLTVRSSEQFVQLVHNLEDDANLDKIVTTRLIFGLSPGGGMQQSTTAAGAAGTGGTLLAKLQPHEARMYRIIAEAYTLKAIAMEKSTPPSSSRFKRVEYEEKVNAAYSVATDLCYIYLQLLSQRLILLSSSGIIAGNVAGTAGNVAGGGTAGGGGGPLVLPAAAAAAAAAAGGGYAGGAGGVGGVGGYYNYSGGSGGAAGVSSTIPSAALQTAMLANIFPTQHSMHEKLVGIILETGLLRGPQLHLLQNQPLWAISQLRDDLHYVQPAPSQLLRLDMLSSLAELLLRRVCGKHFISARQTTTMLLASQQRQQQQQAAVDGATAAPAAVVGSTNNSPALNRTPGGAGAAVAAAAANTATTMMLRRRPEIYAAPNMFLPISAFEEVLLLLLLTEAVCYQINPMINNSLLSGQTVANSAAAGTITATTSTTGGVTQQTANVVGGASHGGHGHHHHSQVTANTTTTTTHHKHDSHAVSPQPPLQPSPVPPPGASAGGGVLPDGAPAPINILDDILSTNATCTEYAQLTCDMLDLWLAHNDLQPLLVPCIERAIRASTAMSENLRRKRAQCLHANRFAYQAELFYDALFNQEPVEGQTGAALDDAAPPPVAARLRPHANLLTDTTGPTANPAGGGATKIGATNSQLKLLDDSFGYNSMERRELLLMRACNLIESHLNVEAGIEIAQQLLEELAYDTYLLNTAAALPAAPAPGSGGDRRATVMSGVALIGTSSDMNAAAAAANNNNNSDAVDNNNNNKNPVAAAAEKIQKNQQQSRGRRSEMKLNEYKRALSTPARDGAAMMTQRRHQRGAASSITTQNNTTTTKRVVGSLQPNQQQQQQPQPHSHALVTTMSTLDRAFYIKAKMLQGLGWAYRAKQRNVIYKRRQFEDRAMQSFRRAHELDRDDAFVHFQLAYQYCLARQMSAAFQHIKQSLTLDPNFLHAVHLFALILSACTGGSQQRMRMRALQFLEDRTLAVRDINIALTRIKLEAVCRSPEAALESCRALLYEWKEMYEGEFYAGGFASVYGGATVGAAAAAHHPTTANTVAGSHAGSNPISSGSHFYYYDNIIGSDDFDHEMAASTMPPPSSMNNTNIAGTAGAGNFTSASGHLMMPTTTATGGGSAAGAAAAGAGGTTTAAAGAAGGYRSRRSTPKPGSSVAGGGGGTGATAGSVTGGGGGGASSTSQAAAALAAAAAVAATAAHDSITDIEEYTASVEGSRQGGGAAGSVIHTTTAGGGGAYSTIMSQNYPNGGAAGTVAGGSDYAGSMGGGGGPRSAAAAAGAASPGVMSQILILIDMAELYVKLGKLNDAWQCLLFGEQLRFGSYLLMHLRGVLNCELGDYEEARHSLQHALAINPWHVPSLIKLGQVAHAVYGDTQLAEKCFRDALHANPFAHVAWLGLGTLTEELEDFASAAYYFNEAQKHMCNEPVRSIAYVPRNYSHRFSNV